jgi:hypothetical protein
VVLHFSLVASVTFLTLGISVWRWPGSPIAGFLLGAGLAGGGAQIGRTRACSLARAVSVTAHVGTIHRIHLPSGHPDLGRPTHPLVCSRFTQVIGASLLLTVKPAPALS